MPVLRRIPVPHLLALLAALLLAAAAASASAAPLLTERSPLRPGLWWDPARAGSGFDVQVAGQQVFVIWYTYRADGSPVWYTAQGRFDDHGLLEADWLQHRWVDGRAGEPQVVGRARLHRLNAERVELGWTLDGSDGVQTLEPLPVAAVLPEVDRSGAWYEAARSGYGFTLAEQGDWRVVALYAYDPAGAPTWLLGTNAGGGEASASLLRFEGACPMCSHVPSRHVAAGQATWQFDGMRMQLALELSAGLVPAGMFAGGVSLEMLSTPAAERPADRQLARFADEAGLLQTLRGLLVAGAANLHLTMGGPVLSPPAAGAVAMSSTNLVESGVDEADRVKSDGRFVYTFHVDDSGRPQPRLRVAEIAAAGPQLALRDTVPLAWPEEARPSEVGLFLDGDRLVALGYDGAPRMGPGPILMILPPPEMWAERRFHVELFDGAAAGAPQSQWRATIDGSLVASRRIGDQLYLVHRSAHLPAGLQRSVSPEAMLHNREVVDAVGLDALLPTIRINGGDPAPLLDPASVLLPPLGVRPPLPEFAIVTRVNLADPSDIESLAVLGGVETVHVASQALYIATSRYLPGMADGTLHWPGFAATEIHRFVLGEHALRLDGSGSVEGVVGRDPDRAPFRFSEHEGRLRLLTTGEFGEHGRNRLHILEPSQVTPGLLAVRTQLPNAGRPAPIGKPHEELYGTRFVGNRLYAVTFLNIDPLYVIDLDPADPSILGELEMPGFSDYLHPLPGGLLLGIGKDAEPAVGWGDGRFALFQGLQIALFDVADPTAPSLLDRVLLGERGSESAALRHHHGFSSLTLADGRLRFTLPARIHGTRHPATSGTGSAFVPWRESGLFGFDVVGSGAGARLQPLAPLITHDTASPPSGHDAASRDARALLTPEGRIYVENGRFWTAPWGAAVPMGPL